MKNKPFGVKKKTLCVVYGDKNVEGMKRKKGTKRNENLGLHRRSNKTPNNGGGAKTMKF